MKKLTTILLLSILFAGCSKDSQDNQEISQINILEVDDDVYVGDEYKLTVDYTPSYIDAPSCLWTSSNTGVISINSNGIFTAKNAGKSIITASIKNSNISHSIEISVLPNSAKPIDPTTPTNPNTPTTPGTPTVPPNSYVGLCGAKTKKGTPCKRRVAGGGRCWQHK